MKAYVINLKTSINRKQYIERLLQPHHEVLDVCFVEGVDGRKLSQEQLRSIWDQDGTFRIYGRYMRGGEIGCALSHRKCYEEFCKSGDEKALIFEDDLSFQDVDVEKIISVVSQELQTNKPMVILLSGDYWYINKSKSFSGINRHLVRVYDGMGAIAYMVNRSAAEIMLSSDKKFLADDWYNWRRMGINIYALYPHIADQKDSLGTEISTAYEGIVRKNLTLLSKVKSYYRAVIKHLILGRMKHFEKRI